LVGVDEADPVAGLGRVSGAAPNDERVPVGEADPNEARVPALAGGPYVRGRVVGVVTGAWVT
jgi:hypothetical protein